MATNAERIETATANIEAASAEAEAASQVMFDFTTFDDTQDVTNQEAETFPSLQKFLKEAQEDIDGVVSGVIATEAEARAGTDNTKMMTPLRTAQSIDELASGGGGSGSTSFTTPNDLGAGAVGKPVYVDANGDAQLASTVSFDKAEVAGICVSVAGGVTKIQVAGEFNDGISGLVAGEVYFLTNVDGEVSIDEPSDGISKPIYKALTATTALVLNYRGLGNEEPLPTGTEASTLMNKTTDITIPSGSDAPLSFDVVSYDAKGYMNGAGTEWTCPEDGRYHVSACVAITNQVANIITVAKILVDGVRTLSNRYESNHDGGNVCFPVSGHINVLKGQKVSYAINHNQTPNMTLVSAPADNYFTISKSGGLQGEKGVANNPNILSNSGFNVSREGLANDAAHGEHVVEQWQVADDSDGTKTASRITDVDDGEYYLNYLCDTPDASISSSQDGSFFTKIEGHKLRGNAYGYASAKKMTLSFQVKSNVTGIFCVAFKNEDNDRSLVSEYEVEVADVWETKEITFVGCTDGVWAKSQNIGLRVHFSFWTGSGAQTSNLDQWQTGNLIASPNQSNLMATASNYIRIRHPKLELGDQATDWENPNVGDEENRMNRYFQKISNIIVIDNVSNNNPSWLFPTPMRVAPTPEYIGSAQTGGSMATGSTGMYQSNNRSLSHSATLFLDARM